MTNAEPIRGIRTLINEGRLAETIINIGSNEEITICDLAEAVPTEIETESKISYEPLPEDDSQRWQPDTSRAKSRLEREPTIKLEHRIQRTSNHFEQEI